MLITGSISHVGVLGAGMMGRGITQVFAQAGYEVALFDSNAEVLHAAAEALAAEGTEVHVATDMRELAERSQFITEAIIENLDIKQSVFKELGSHNPDAILASNSSVLPITAIAKTTELPARTVGTHWWNPPTLIPIVEVIRGGHTSDVTMDVTFELMERIGKMPVRVERDVPGFVGNRLQHALWREAIALIADGVCDAHTVDLVVRNTIGLRLAAMGPIENADFVGLDLTLAIHEAVLPAINSTPGPSPLLRELVEQGHLGAKSGAGFLPWPDGARAAAAARLAAHVKGQLKDRTGS